MLTENTTSINQNKTQQTIHEFMLYQNYPNPFNAKTKILFSLNRTLPTLLTIYNLSGQKITTLVKEIMHRGIHEVVFDGSNLSSGIYLYQLRAGRQVINKKLILIK